MTITCSGRPLCRSLDRCDYTDSSAGTEAGCYAPARNALDWAGAASRRGVRYWMLNVQEFADLVSRAGEFYRHYVPATWVPYPNLVAVGTIAVGILLAFWGARLLRTIYILGFMVIGAAEGLKVGAHLNIDTLVGLTFGAGIAALIGYLLYRWWVGLTTGAVAVLIVLAVAWPRIQALEQDYLDYRGGVGTGDFSHLLENEQQTPAEYAVGLGQYIWTQRWGDFGGKSAVAVGLAWLLGTVLGLVLPKFTTVLGTSLVGVGLVGGGLGVLLWRSWPEVWSKVAVHPDWYLVGMGALLIASIWRQTRSGPARASAPPSPQPPAGTSGAQPSPAK